MIYSGTLLHEILANATLAILIIEIIDGNEIVRVKSFAPQVFSTECIIGMAEGDLWNQPLCS